MINRFRANIPGWGQATLLVSFVMLTLLASCSVRKSVHAELGLPVSTQPNPSKAVVQMPCQYTDNATVGQYNDVRQMMLSSASLPAFFISLFLTHEGQFDRSYLTGSRRETFAKVPIYILYRKMKVSL